MENSGRYQHLRVDWVGESSTRSITLCGAEGEDIGTGQILCPDCAQVGDALKVCGLGPKSLRISGQPAEQLLEVMTLPRSKRRWRRWARWGPCWICRIGSLSTESPSPEGDGFGRHKHARPAEASFRSRPDRRLSAAALRRFRSLRDLLKASPKGEGFHPSPRGTLTGVTIEPLRKTRGGSHPCRQLCENRIENLIEPSKAMRIDNI